MVKPFVLPYASILPPRTLRTPPVSRRSPPPGLSRARNLARPFGVEHNRASCHRPQRIRASPHRRRLAPISWRRHSPRAFPRPSIQTTLGSLPGRRRLRHPALPAALTRDRHPAASLAQAPFPRRLLLILELAPPPSF